LPCPPAFPPNLLRLRADPYRAHPILRLLAGNFFFFPHPRENLKALRQRRVSFANTVRPGSGQSFPDFFSLIQDQIPLFGAAPSFVAFSIDSPEPLLWKFEVHPAVKTSPISFHQPAVLWNFLPSIVLSHFDCANNR